ncbi:MAG TPA: PilZ domain-containing protein [Pyrinomonadaceae bacterium]|nr:PilZ domain-containing protein [Pyrinomonadaceae bacterium]
MADVTITQKREAERVRAFEKIYFRVEDSPEYWGVITSLSTKGCFVQPCVDEGRANLRISLRIHLPVNEAGVAEPQVVRGRVMYCMLKVGMGVQFEELSEVEAAGIRRMVEYYRGLSMR